jgi:hypothetical protein
MMKAAISVLGESPCWHLSRFGSLFILQLASVRPRLCLIALVIGMVLSATADEAIQSLGFSNYTTGYLISADAVYPGAAERRDTIQVAASVKYSTLVPPLLPPKYLVSFRLLDTNSQPVMVYGSSGQPANAYNLEDSIAFSRLVRSRTNSYAASLKPVGKLSPYQQYKVELQLYRQEGTNFVNTGQRAVTEARTFYHFNNLVSGDAALNVIATLKDVSFSRTYLVKSIEDKNSFTATAQVELRRYDDFTNSITTSNINLYLEYSLRESGLSGALIPIKIKRAPLVQSLASYALRVNPQLMRVPAVVTAAASFEIEPADGVQLDPVNKSYVLGVSVSHYEAAGIPAETGNTLSSLPQRLLHFNGSLKFGDIQTTINSISNVPAPGQVVAPFYVKTFLAVDRTNSVVSDDGATGFTIPMHRFGDGSMLDVRLRADGVAELASGATRLYPRNTPDLAYASRVRVYRNVIVLDTQGAHCGLLTVILPNGLGYCTDTATNTLINFGGFVNVGLNQNLLPKTNLTYQGIINLCEESKPLWIECSAITWKVSEGVFEMVPTGKLTFVRRGDIAELEDWGPALVDPSAATKPSNDGYFRFVNYAPAGPIMVATDRHGNAELSLDMSMKAGRFQAHFPLRADVWWNGPGFISITNDLVDSRVSYLPNLKQLEVDYAQECTQLSCPGTGTLAPLEFVADEDRLVFTCDGGLTASGQLMAPRGLSWGFIQELGKYAHRTAAFSGSSFLMPGVFLRGDQAPLSMVHRPGVLLLTGVGEQEYGYLERPETPAYQYEGRANYAGLNFRVALESPKTADSVLAGKPTGAYPLTDRSKYYLRAGGVSGIHEAIHGKFPKTAQLYGYEVNFSNFGLSFLDSQNQASRTEGYLSVPFPSNFKQEFEELKFSCLGALESASVPASSSNKLMAYWLADFNTEAIQFQRSESSACNPGVGFLVLGVTAHAAHVEPPLYGSLGFLSDGNLITRRMWQLPEFAGKVPEIDSRLKLPTLVPIRGPAGESYTFTPVSDGYYNNHNYDPNNATNGFINLAGKLDVPFFEDLKVHIHTSAQASNSFAPIFMMGGWSRDAKDLNAGWNNANDGTNYFIQASFDGDNVGFPNDAVTLDQYRQAPNNPYRVRAMQTWLSGINFDFPLSWSSATRAFKSSRPATTDFLILNVEDEVNYLSPKSVDLVFGKQYDGLPQITQASLAFNAEGNQGVASAMDQAAPGTRPVMVNGLQKMDVVVGNQLNTFFKPVLDEFLDQQVNALYQELKTAYAGQNPNQNWSGWSNAVQIALNHYLDNGGTLDVKFKHQLVGDPSSEGMLKQLKLAAQALINAIDALNGSSGFLPAGGNHERAKALAVALIAQLAPEYSGIVSSSTLDASLQALAPALSQIRSSLEDYKAELASQVTLLENQTKAQLESETQNAYPVINSALNKASKDIFALVLTSLDYSKGVPFESSLAPALKAKLRQAVEDRFFTTPLMANLQVVFRSRFQDKNVAVREALDSFFLQINQVVRDAISPSLAQADRQFQPLFGDLGGLMSAAGIHGAAHINGDALNEVRLDGRFQWQVPETLEFGGSLIVRAQNSTGTKTGCGDPGGKAPEIILEGNNVALDWFSPDLKANISGKFSFDASPSPRLIGVGGGFVLLSGLTFEAFRINSLSAMFAFGAHENYISGAAAVQFQDYKLSGGIYFGRTCTLDPIALWDPQVAGVLGQPPFTGAYVYGEGWMPIYGNGCVFNISAGVGAGAFYFLEGPTFGGKLMAGVSGEALCLVSIQGDVHMVGVKQGGSFQYNGQGHVSGKAGSCPFCIKFSKTIGVSYQNGSWDVDF